MGWAASRNGLEKQCCRRPTQERRKDTTKQRERERERAGAKSAKEGRKRERERDTERERERERESEREIASRSTSEHALEHGGAHQPHPSCLPEEEERDRGSNYTCQGVWTLWQFLLPETHHHDNDLKHGKRGKLLQFDVGGIRHDHHHCHSCSRHIVSCF